jgi:branched-subunit amino acid aminotransferase/4-amino-4-deoxychorismate lyase
MSSSKDFASVVMLDGVLLDAAGASVPASWPALMRGEGIFEAFLVSDSQPPAFLADHDARLCLSARLSGFEIHPGELSTKLKDFLRAIKKGQWRVRCTILRGENYEQHWMFSAGPEQPSPESVVLAISDFRLDPLDPMAGAKTISRAMHQRARAVANQQGAFEALLLTIDGKVAEGTSTNVFILKGQQLRTPPLNQGILGGVTRQNVLRACKVADIDCVEAVVSIDDLKEADEIYVTNAVIGLTPVTKILQIREVLPGLKGSKLIEIQKAYRLYTESITTDDVTPAR